MVLTPDSMDFFQSAAMYNHIRRLAKERDHYLTHWANLAVAELPAGEETNRRPGKQGVRSHNIPPYNTSTPNITDSNHLAVELADWKARLRKQRQEL